MAANRDPGTVDVAVGLRVGGLDHLVDVDGVLGREPGELVGQADVDIAESGLCQLGQLRRLGAAEIPHTVAALKVGTLVEVEHGLVEGRGSLGALVRQAAYELGVPAQVGEDATCEHPLGAEDEVEVSALAQAGALLQHRPPAVSRRAHGERRLEGDERASGEVGGDVARGRVHPAEVRGALLVDEQRDDNDHGVRAGHRVCVVRGGTQPARLDRRGHLGLQVRLAGERLLTGVDARHRVGVDVDADDLMTLVGELHRERESDLAQGNDSNPHVYEPQSRGWSFFAPTRSLTTGRSPSPTARGAVQVLGVWHPEHRQRIAHGRRSCARRSTPSPPSLRGLGVPPLPRQWCLPRPRDGQRICRKRLGRHGSHLRARGLLPLYRR